MGESVNTHATTPTRDTIRMIRRLLESMLCMYYLLRYVPIIITPTENRCELTYFEVHCASRRKVERFDYRASRS